MRYDSKASARTRGRAPFAIRRRSAAAASLRLGSLPRSIKPSSSCAMCDCCPFRLTVANRSMTSGRSSSTDRCRPSTSSTTFSAFIASCSGLASIACASSTSSLAVSSETRPISFRYMRTGSSSETESIISMSSSISSSICSTSSKSFSPSVTSIPISLNAAKMRKIWSGSASIWEALEDVIGRQVALLLALDDQLLGDRHQLVFELLLRLLAALRRLALLHRPFNDRRRGVVRRFDHRLDGRDDRRRRGFHRGRLPRERCLGERDLRKRDLCRRRLGGRGLDHLELLRLGRHGLAGGGLRHFGRRLGRRLHHPSDISLSFPCL